MDDLFLIVGVLLAVVFVVWMSLAKQAKTVQAQAAEAIAGLDYAPQSKTVQDLGIAIATLESVLLHLGAARAAGQSDSVLLDQHLLAAQSQLHQVQMQVEDGLSGVPEADSILDALERTPSLADAPPQGWPEAAETMNLAQMSVRETIANLEAARARVRAEEETASAEQLLAARLEAEVRHTEAVEAAREAGTASARTGGKERS